MICPDQINNKQHTHSLLPSPPTPLQTQLRLNTNGLGSVAQQRPLAPEVAGLFHAVTVAVNTAGKRGDRFGDIILLRLLSPPARVPVRFLVSSFPFFCPDLPNPAGLFLTPAPWPSTPPVSARFVLFALVLPCEPSSLR